MSVPAQNPAFKITLPKDRASLQTAINELIEMVASNHIDEKRAALIFRLLSMASRNLTALEREAKAASKASQVTPKAKPQTTTSPQPIHRDTTTTPAKTTQSAVTTKPQLHRSAAFSSSRSNDNPLTHLVTARAPYGNPFTVREHHRSW